MFQRVRSILRAAAIATLLSFSTPALSLDISVSSGTITLSGDVVSGDYEKVLLAILLNDLNTTTPIKEIVLENSPGGVFLEAVNMGILFRDSGYTTKAKGLCASACAYMWLAGVERVSYSDTTLGMHAPYIPDSVPLSAAEREATNDIFMNMANWYMGYVGVSFDASAIFLTVPPDKVLILTPVFMDSFSITHRME